MASKRRKPSMDKFCVRGTRGTKALAYAETVAAGPGSHERGARGNSVKTRGFVCRWEPGAKYTRSECYKDSSGKTQCAAGGHFAPKKRNAPKRKPVKKK